MIWPTDAAAKGAQFTVVRQGLETRYELAIPWSEIGDKPKAGASYPFNLTLGDRDRDESHKVVNWCGARNNPQRGAIRLMGP